MGLDPGKLAFRPLQMADLELEWRWRNAGEVKKWYSKREVPLAEVTEKLMERIEGRAPTACFIILYEGRPIGHIQTYRVRDYQWLADAWQIGEEAASVDMFIAEPEYQHRGLGSHVLRKFLREVVFARYDVVSCVVGPEVPNVIAQRAYEKAGLRYLKTVQEPGEDQPTYLMRITREDATEG